METGDTAAIFHSLDTPSVSDALDRLGLVGQCLGIAPLESYVGTIAGPAFTVRYAPAASPPGTVGDFIDDVPAGSVVVIDNGGRADCTVWGDIMTQFSAARGIAATVIDGVCRDVGVALRVGYPLFTRGRFMRTGKDRVQVEAVGDAVAIGGARVSAGDIVVADVNGVVVVPRDRAAEIAALAQSIEAAEAAIRERIADGASLASARQALGYHDLQKRAR